MNKHNEGDSVIISFLCKSTTVYEIIFNYNNKYVGSSPKAVDVMHTVFDG